MNAPTEMPTMEFELEVTALREIVAELSLADLLEGVKSPGFPERIGSYQYTHSGRLFFPCDPRPEEVFIKDIARGVSGLHRFNGQTTSRMTVAEHLYLASFEGPPATALERLMHDASEAYIGDVIRPLKVIPIFGDLYLKIERGIEQAIATRYSLHYPFPPDVRFADEVIAHVEVARNIGSKAINHMVDPALKALVDNSKKSHIGLFLFGPTLAEEMFLDRFYELATERGIEPF